MTSSAKEGKDCVTSLNQSPKEGSFHKNAHMLANTLDASVTRETYSHENTVSQLHEQCMQLTNFIEVRTRLEFDICK